MIKRRESRRKARSNTNALEEIGTHAISAEEIDRLKRELAEKERMRQDIEDYEKRRDALIASKRSTQNALHYEAMLEDGICRLRKGVYSSAVSVENASFPTLSANQQKTIYANINKWLNGLSPEVAVQIYIHNRLIENEVALQEASYAIWNSSTDDIRSSFNAHIEGELEKKAAVLRSSIQIIHTVKAENAQEARIQLNDLEKEVDATFNSKVVHLDGVERLRSINALTRPDEVFNFEYESLLETRRDTKDAIAPPSFRRPDFKEASNRIFLGDTYGKVYGVTNYPNNLDDNYLARMMNVPCDSVIAIHYRQENLTESLKRASQQLTDLEQVRSGRNKKARERGDFSGQNVSGAFEKKIEAAEWWYDDLSDRNQKRFDVNMFVYTYSKDNSTLEKNVRLLKQRSEEYVYRLDPLAYYEVETFNSVLPLGNVERNIEVAMPTYDAASFIPFSHVEFQTKSDWRVFNGVSTDSNGFVYYSQFDISSPHTFRFGKTGSGKSMDAKLEMLQLWLDAEDIQVKNGLQQRYIAQFHVQDPDSEYRSFIEYLGGVYLDFKTNSDFCINPCAIVVDDIDSDDPINAQIEFLTGFMELVYPVNEQDRSILGSEVSRACKAMYAHFDRNAENQAMPTLSDLKRNLEASSHPIAREAATALWRYTDGDLTIFNGQTSIDIDSPFIGYGFKEAPESVKNIFMYLTMNNVWTSLIKNDSKGISTFIYFNEFQSLLKSQTASEYFFKLFPRARKHNGFCTAMTQVTGPIAKNVTAEAALQNSSTVKIFHIDPGDRAYLAENLDIPIERIDEAAQSDIPGRGMLKHGNKNTVFNNLWDKDSLIYQLCQTDRKDLKR